MEKEKHFKLSDTEFEEQFRSCSLNPDIFSHEAHLRLAWIHINKYGIEQAEKNIPSQLQNYVASIGANNKFNTTLTVAAVKVVYHFALKSKPKSFEQFISEFPRLTSNFRELLDTHYGFDIFYSKNGRVEYLEPDLLPFD